MNQAAAENLFDEELYNELEQACLPLLRRAAGKHATINCCNINDAMQEVRIAFFQALAGYDYNKSSGGISNFVAMAVKNALIKLWTSEQRPKRMLWVLGENSTFVRQRPLPYPDFESFASRGCDPETELIDNESRRILKMKLLNRLNDRQRQVFGCLMHPSEEFTTYMRNIAADEATVKVIAGYLGLSKNVVDWSIRQIKSHFTDLLESDFHEVVELAVKSGRWPMFHISRKFEDMKYVRQILTTRKFDPRPLVASEVIDRLIGGVRIQRSIESYSWGAVVMLRFGDHAATVIAEGSFNATTGRVLSSDGFCKQLDDVLDWYPEMVKALHEKASRPRLRKTN
jgi:RNA polymerase sigma factor (sigma-70 family)